MNGSRVLFWTTILLFSLGALLFLTSPTFRFIIQEDYYTEVSEQILNDVRQDNWKYSETIWVEYGQRNKFGAKESEEDGLVKILFKENHGFSDNFSGYFYSSLDLSPTMGDFLCGTIVKQKKLKENWYWLSCT